MIINFVYIAIGAFFGAMARYFFTTRLSRQSTRFPIGTFAVNMIGSFLMGYLLKSPFEKHMQLLLVTGFMGSFTTFSTFIYENLTVIKSKKWIVALLYIVISISLGVGFAYIGYKLG